MKINYPFEHVMWFIRIAQDQEKAFSHLCNQYPDKSKEYLYGRVKALISHTGWEFTYACDYLCKNPEDMSNE